MFRIRFVVIFTYSSYLDIDVEKNLYYLYCQDNINSLEFPFSLLRTNSLC